MMRWTEVPTPEPGPGQVRIEVHAAGVNRADLLQRRGLYPPPPGASDILGLECAGIIEAVGRGVPESRIGEPVCALLSGGGYAQAAVCPVDHLLPIPDGLSFAEAAALPEAWATAWLKLIVEGELKPGEHVILHAGASGVGTAAIQLCRQRSNPCFVTVGSQEKLKFCQELGADSGAVRHDVNWAEAARSWQPAGADLILDPVGGSYLEANLKSLGPGGRLVIMGLLGGRRAEVDLGRILVKRLKVVGSTLRSRSDPEKALLVESLRTEIWPHFESSAIGPVIYRQTPITEADGAHSLLWSNATIGKVVLVVH
jgi:putative PIG3 family NAD(P)H quinone oxidoreductase